MKNANDPVLTPYPPAEFLRYFDLFNGGDYFEAHEILEDLWVMTPGAERSFYKGLIMLAVGLLHVERKNKRGAIGVLAGAMTHLGGYPPGYGGLDRSDGEERARKLLRGEAMESSRPLMRWMA